MRWKITVEYDGSDFCGWQRQLAVPTVQQTLEDAVKKFSGETVKLHVAGRTDAGVHAFANVAHFDLLKDTNANVIRDALNFHVRPHRVSVIRVEAKDETFHARFHAQARSYLYRIANRRTPLALAANRAWHVARPLTLAPMQEAAQILVGHHDFSTFRAQGCQSKSPMKTLDLFEVSRDDETFTFHIQARSFLYHQVRNMVGTLMMVGTLQWSIDDFRAAFEARDRTKGGPMAPPQGLFFKEVAYQE